VRITDEELIDRLDHGGRDDLAADPILVVECRGPTTVEIAGLENRLAGLPVLLVAIVDDADHAVAGALDVVAVDDAEVDRFEQAVRRHDEAAVSLAVLLRGVRHRPVAEGLAVESATYSMLQAGPDHRRWLRERGSRASKITPTGDVVQMRRAGDHLRITLNRPENRNAFSAEMRDTLLEALAVLAADESLVATLDARGPSFCSGGDLREFGTVDNPAIAHLLRLRRNVGRAIDEVAERITVEVHGHCIGAGVELPSFARRVVAKADATFCLPELRMGLIPGAGGTVSIPRRIGRQHTLRLALLGEPIDATTALDWGLVDAIAR
jgi:hypothetical protein